VEGHSASAGEEVDRLFGRSAQLSFGRVSHRCDFLTLGVVQEEALDIKNVMTLYQSVKCGTQSN
jgi:hypothetical protein